MRKAFFIWVVYFIATLSVGANPIGEYGNGSMLSTPLSLDPYSNTAFGGVVPIGTPTALFVYGEQGPRRDNVMQQQPRISRKLSGYFKPGKSASSKNNGSAPQSH